jgi:hypothetical protein
VPTVGDSLRDLQAGFISGCAPYLVLTGKGEKTHATGGLPPGTQVFPDLAAMVDRPAQGNRKAPQAPSAATEPRQPRLRPSTFQGDLFCVTPPCSCVPCCSLHRHGGRHRHLGLRLLPRGAAPVQQALLGHLALERVRHLVRQGHLRHPLPVQGLRQPARRPAILLSKHQSAWETIFLLPNMPHPLVFVFKKEILYIPFFGWAWRCCA